MKAQEKKSCFDFYFYISIIWASSRENLSSGFPTKRDSNQSPQLQRRARKLKFRSKFRYDTFQKTNNKGADQTAHMCRLVCAFVVRKPLKTDFLTSRPICSSTFKKKITVLLPAYQIGQHRRFGFLSHMLKCR